MNKRSFKKDPGALKPIRVLDRYFVYNELTAAHAEVDSKDWTLLCNSMEKTSGGGDSFKFGTQIRTLLKDHPPCDEKPKDPGIKNIVLQSSHSCNLRCKYCNADFGRYGGGFRTMSLDTAKRAVDFLFDNTESNELAITYFGGEPLLDLATVLGSATYSLERAERAGKKVSLHLVTNGVFLDFQTLKALDRLGFSLTVSLDGPPGHHDTYRPFPNGKGSHAHTAWSLRAATNLPIWYRTTVRGTFTRHSAYFFPLVKYLAEENFSMNIAYEPVFLRPSHPLAIRWRDLPAIKKAYTDLARYYVKRLKRGEPFCLWDFDDAIGQLIAQRPRQSRCGSGVTTVSVTAEGDLYGCHMSTGMEGSWIGDLNKGIVEKKKRPWRDVYLRTRKGCSGCWLRALCGGGCNTHAITYNGDISTPYRLECELIKCRYRLALWILAQFPELREAVRSSRGTDKKTDSGHVVVSLWYHLEQAERLQIAGTGVPPLRLKEAR